jgi:hypothetical protein
LKIPSPRSKIQGEEKMAKTYFIQVPPLKSSGQKVYTIPPRLNPNMNKMLGIAPTVPGRLQKDWSGLHTQVPGAGNFFQNLNPGNLGQTDLTNLGLDNFRGAFLGMGSTPPRKTTQDQLNKAIGNANSWGNRFNENLAQTEGRAPDPQGGQGQPHQGEPGDPNQPGDDTNTPEDPPEDQGPEDEGTGCGCGCGQIVHYLTESMHQMTGVTFSKNFRDELTLFIESRLGNEIIG